MTDHAAEARRILESPGIVTRDDEARQNAAEAQVHATLALADEQRTANLLAVLALHVSHGTSLPAGLAARVDARLGLTPTTPNQEQ